MELIRSFVAFDIGEAAVLRNLAKVQDVLLGTGADLKLVKPENIHITLRFLGDVTPDMVDRIHGEMQQVQFQPFEVNVKGVGVFPNQRHISVVWAGSQRAQGSLRPAGAQAAGTRVRSRLQVVQPALNNCPSQDGKEQGRLG